MKSNHQKSYYQYQCEGGTLPITAETYVPRKADEDLYQFSKSNRENNRVCSILAPRQTGKSSLMARTAYRLSNEGLICVQINLQELGRVDSDEKLWYSLLEEICKQIDEIIEQSKQANAPPKQIYFTAEGFVYKLDEVWGLKPDMPGAKRFTNFITDEILTKTNGEKLIVFLDEIQSLIRWEVKDSFIGYIKAISDNVNKAALQRLKFVILGVAKPSEFVTSRGIALNVGMNIEIGNLSGKCDQLKPGIEEITNEPQKVIDIILNWTGGQPFLTQTICHLLVSQDQIIEGDEWESYIGNIITDKIITNWRIQDRQSHLQEIEKSIIRIDNNQKNHKLAALANYQIILNQGLIRWDEKDTSQWDLLISGLVIKGVAQTGCYLTVANRIYEQIFNLDWMRAVQNQLNSSKDNPVFDEISAGTSSRPPIVNLPRNQGKMVANNDELIDKGLKLLRDGVLPFVEKEMTESCGINWLQHREVAKILQSQPKKKNQANPHLDTQALLKIIWNNWNEVFSHTLDQEERTLVSELLMTRNKAKHDESFTNEDGYRALDSITRLLKAVSASTEIVTEVERMKNDLLRKQFEEQASFNQPATDQLASTQIENTTESITLVESEPLGEKNQTAASISIEESMPQPNFPVTDGITDNRRFPMSRAKQIENIIEKRRPLVQKIEGVEANLRELDSGLRELESHRIQLLTKVDETSIKGRLLDVDFLRIQLNINAELDALAKLRIRFSRDTLNIGVVGRARQGKSRLLQSLTGLTAAEIPDGDRQHCTGVRSIIRHNPSIDTHGEVLFYSEQSFLKDVICPYYEKLRLGVKPTTLVEFTNKLLPPMPSDLPGYAEPGAMYEHLSGYHANYYKYSSLLNSPPRRISKDQIREYVAQDDANGKRVFFNYLAVKEVKIICSFPNSEVGQIALVDMPGLGDTGIGDEERLIKTLGQDIDAVLFVRMPKPSGDYWADVDVRLYDSARTALVDLPLNLWSFMILNRTDAGSRNGDNSNNCQDLASEIHKKRIEVVDCLNANCADVNEANTLVLDRVLNYLADQINGLDRQYASACQERLIQLQSAVSAELEKARQALVKASRSQNEMGVFEPLFKKLNTSLKVTLVKLLDEFNQQRDTEDVNFFKPKVEAAIQACREDTGIPSLEEIEERHGSTGSWYITYDEFLHRLRTTLTRHFGSMDTGLKQAVDYAKDRVVEALVNAARLGGLTTVRGPEFLKVLADIVPDEQNHLKTAFKKLWDFKMAYEVNFHYRIRQHLDDLTPDKTSLRPSRNPTPQEILECLDEVQKTTLYRCQEALESMYAEPSQAAFAAVEEFIDQVIRAEEAETDWRIFLFEVRSQVWPSEFEPVGEGSDVRREWQQLVTRAESANQPNSMLFIN